MSKPARPALTFTAALAAPPRKCLTIDSDGEAVLTLLLDAQQAPKVAVALQYLTGVAFRVDVTIE